MLKTAVSTLCGVRRRSPGNPTKTRPISPTLPFETLSFTAYPTLNISFLKGAITVVIRATNIADEVEQV